MRVHRHDFRDLALAFGLSFDLRRVSQAAVALSWTLIVLMGVVSLLSWRAGGMLRPDGMLLAWESATTGWTPLKGLIWSCVIAGWWAGFAYLAAPAMRSAALDIARDERDRECNIPSLNRQAAFSPLLVGVPAALALACVVLWALLTLIPGVTGGVLAAVTLPIALLAAAAGAVFLVVGVLAAPMMGPAAVVEGRDYLEALSRPMSYVMQRPGRYFAYWAAKLGVVGASAVAGAAVLAVVWGMVGLALWIIGQGDLAARVMTEISAEGTASFEQQPAAFGIAVVFWSSLFVLAAWLMVVALNCDMLIYLLMRYRVDGVTFDKITVAEEKLKVLKNATETAIEAEEARKRFDAANPEPTAAQPQT
jgi:hypothetical protein